MMASRCAGLHYRDNHPMPLDHWIEQTLFLAYRWADYALRNLMG